MKMKMLKWYLTLISITITTAKEPELPLCPTNIQFFPQNLPMHCRMPSNAVFQNLPQSPGAPLPQTLPPMLPPFFQTPPPDKMPEPIPIPVPPGIPGPMPFPGPVPVPMPMPMPIPMQGPPGPGHKLPVIVMPFYSPDPSYKKRPPPPRKPKQKRKKQGIFNKKRRIDSDDTSSDTDTDTSDESSDTSSDRGWWKKRIGRSGRKSNRHPKKIKRKHNKKKDLLTPLLQYVTKDGYVIYEKKISNGEAKDWLSVKNEDEKNVNRNLKAETENNKSEKADADAFEDVKPNDRIKEERFAPETEIVHATHTKKHKPRQHKPNSGKSNLPSEPT